MDSYFSNQELINRVCDGNTIAWMEDKEIRNICQGCGNNLDEEECECDEL